MHECPKCGTPMEQQEYDPSVGVLSGGWFCTQCEDVFVPDYEYDDEP